MVFVCIDFAMQQLPAKYVINFMFFCAGFEQSELNFDLQRVLFRVPAPEARHVS